MSQFGFSVMQGKKYDKTIHNIVNIEGTWNVFLPHQSDVWGITDTCLDSYNREGIPKEDAVEIFESFIAEAQEALTALKNDREIGERL